MSKKLEVLDRLKEHLKLEEEEVTSYTLALNRAKNPVLNLLFRSFLEDSKRHTNILRTVIAYFHGLEKDQHPFVKQIEEAQIEETVDPAAEERVQGLLQIERDMIQDPFIDLLLESIALDEVKHARLAQGLLKIVESTRS